MLRLITIPFIDRDTILSLDSFERMSLEEENAARSYLKKVQASVPIDRITIEISNVIGHPAKTIVDFAEKHNVDLISMSDHGHSGIRQWLFGSVAERVVPDASCATLVVRRQEKIYNEGQVRMGVYRDV